MHVNYETPLSENDFNKFRNLIYSIAGISLSDRKRELVKSRLARRLRALGLDSYSDYYHLLTDPTRADSEIQSFTNSLTTNKTEFYREAHHFDYLREKLLPQIKQHAQAGRDPKVRIWCAASSTGQEPYTLAMTLLDFFGSSTNADMRILASDIDTQVLATAMEGVYPEADTDPIPKHLLKRYFHKLNRQDEVFYQAKDELKQLITFRQLNLNHPQWPINTTFDAIFCRNVMIYFDQATQKKLVERFAELLVPRGLLVIGHSESLFSISDQFDSLGETIYCLKSGMASDRKKPGVAPVVARHHPQTRRRRIMRLRKHRPPLPRIDQTRVRASQLQMSLRRKSLLIHG